MAATRTATLICSIRCQQEESSSNSTTNQKRLLSVTKPSWIVRTEVCFFLLFYFHFLYIISNYCGSPTYAYTFKTNCPRIFDAGLGCYNNSFHKNSNYLSSRCETGMLQQFILRKLELPLQSLTRNALVLLPLYSLTRNAQVIPDMLNSNYNNYYLYSTISANIYNHFRYE